MGTIDGSGLPEQALLLVDSAPIIYVLDRHPEFGPRFRPLFEAQEAGNLRFAITTVTMIEVLTGALAAGDEVQARRYRKVFESWTVVGLDETIAERAAQWRASLRLKLPDAVQLASAFAINADALVTHDRDFSRVKGLRIIC
jgi:predicted nucleic acid-binding protein